VALQVEDLQAQEVQALPRPRPGRQRLQQKLLFEE